MREDVDPRIDKMIAFLYGELPPAEEKAFRRLLEKDEALRAEYESLKQVRGALAGWEVEEHVPSFVLVDPRAERPTRRGVPGGAWARMTEWLRSIGPGPAWAFATAVVALVVLAAAGFRVEKVPGGLAFRFGGEDAQQTPVFAEGQPIELGEGRPVEFGEGQPLESPTTDESFARRGTGPLPVNAPYVTRGEFEQYNTDLMTTLVGLLNQYDERRDEETADLLRAFYGKINERQMFDYERVNRRIDALDEGLTLESNRSRSIEDLLQQGQSSADRTNPARAAEEE